MRKTLGVCVIGTGRAGMIHARDYNGNVPGAQLVALCDPFEPNLKAAQDELGVERTYADYRDALKDPDVDAVVVVTPTGTHQQIVCDAAAAGKHVFCEKPMASSVEECEQMIAACHEANVKLQLGFMRRFDKGFRRAKEVVDSGAIGDITLVKSLTHGPSEPKEWMYDITKSGGPIGEVNSHDLDCLRWIVGSEVKSVRAIGHNFRSPEKREQYPNYYDTVAMLLEFQNGVLGMIDGAQYVQYGYDARAEVLGTKGLVTVGSQRDNSVTVAQAGMTLGADSMPTWRTLFKDAYVEEDRAFANCVLNDTDPEVTGQDGLMALRLVNAALESLLEGRAVEL